MTKKLRYKKFLVIIIANIIIAFCIASVTIWLAFWQGGQSPVPAGVEPYLIFLKIFLLTLLMLLLFAYWLIRTSWPILEELLHNIKDVNKFRNKDEKSEKVLGTLLKNLPVGLIIYNVKQDRTQFNDYANAYLGFSKNVYKIKDLIGPPFHLIGEDGSDIPLSEYPLNTVIATHGTIKNKVVGIVGPAGNVVWMLYNAFPVFNFLGHLKQVIVMFSDVTDYKLMDISLKEANNKLSEQSEELTQLLDNLKDANARLAESEARYKLISDFSNSWETFRHPDGKLIYCSPYVEQIIGYTREEYLKGIPFSSFVHPDDLKDFTERFNKALAGKLVPSCVVRLLHKNQEIRWVDSEMRPVFSETGELLGTRYSIWDITKLKETELALQESRELLNLVFQYSSNWESYSDKNGNLVYCSLAFEQLLGYPVKDYMSRKIGIRDIVHPDDYETAMSQLELARSGKTIPSHILRYVTKNKSIVWADVSTRPVFSESGEMLGIRFSSRDITKLKENEFELKELNATKDKFFSIISHDLRSPFSALIGFSDVLLEEHKDGSAEHREELISIINKVSKDTFGLLENLLNWARSQSGKLILNQEKVNLKQLSSEIIDVLGRTAKNKKITLSNAVFEDIWVWADYNILNTIIRNLISNSIKYTKEDGKVTLGAFINDGYAEISVSDTGVGFDCSLLNSMFKIGENRSTPGTNNEKGTGLGLILCKEFVEKMGGTICATSEPGRGAKFYFTVPLYK